jgi:prepilin-type N-terminal cleavage/methylation domain-containing protein
MRLGRPVRRGLSLLEVLVALAIFLLSLVGLGFLLTVAGNTALETQYRTQAAGMCQSKLAEVAAGAVPLEGQSDVPFDEDPDYHWSLEVQAGTPQGLHNVTVRVSRKRPDGSMMECSLSQMVMDPAMVGSVHDVLASITGDDSSSSSTSSTSSSSTTGASKTGATTGGTGSGSKSKKGQ